MRDLLSKLDSIVSETALKDKEDLEAKRKALDDLEADPVASKDPEISAAIDQRRADLEKEAKSKGMSESFEIGDDFGISFSEDFELSTEIVGFVEDGIVIDLDETALNYLSENGIVFVEGELQEGLRDPKDNPCWKGYKPVGTKKKGGRTVPNCVPKESVEKDSDVDEGILDFFKKKPRDPKNFEEYMVYDTFTIFYDPTDETFIVKGRGEWEDKLPTKEFDALGYGGITQAQAYGEYGTGGLKDPIKINRGVINRGAHEDFEDVDEAEYRGKNVPLGKKLPGDVKKSKVYVRKPNGNIVKVNFGDKKMRIKKSNPARRRSFRARHNCKNPGPRWKARYWSCRSW